MTTSDSNDVVSGRIWDLHHCTYRYSWRRISHLFHEYQNSGIHDFLNDAASRGERTGQFVRSERPSESKHSKTDGYVPERELEVLQLLLQLFSTFKKYSTHEGCEGPTDNVVNETAKQMARISALLQMSAQEKLLARCDYIRESFWVAHILQRIIEIS